MSESRKYIFAKTVLRLNSLLLLCLSHLNKAYGLILNSTFNTDTKRSIQQNRETWSSTMIKRYLIESFIRSFILNISIAPLQVHYYSEALQLQHWYCVGVNMPKRYMQLWVKDLPKVLKWQLERDLNLQPSGRKALCLPLSHHAPHIFVIRCMKQSIGLLELRSVVKYACFSYTYKSSDLMYALVSSCSGVKVYFLSENLGVLNDHVPFSAKTCSFGNISAHDNWVCNISNKS